MALDDNDQKLVKDLVAAGVKEVVTASVTEALNAYDKGRSKKLKTVEDDMEALKRTLKPKKLAKMLARMDELKNGKPPVKDGAVKTEAEKAADKKAADDAAALAAGGGKQKKKDDDNTDLFRKKRDQEHEDRIRALEATNVAAEAKAENAIIDSALDRALTDFPWESTNSRDLARNLYRPQMKRNDEGNLIIGDRPFDEHIKSEIPTKYENLLASKNKSGSGITRGTGKVAAVDIDSVTATSSSDDKAAAARRVAELLGAGM